MQEHHREAVISLNSRPGLQTVQKTTGDNLIFLTICAKIIYSLLTFGIYCWRFVLGFSSLTQQILCESHHLTFSSHWWHHTHWQRGLACILWSNHLLNKSCWLNNKAVWDSYWLANGKCMSVWGQIKSSQNWKCCTTDAASCSEQNVIRWRLLSVSERNGWGKDLKAVLHLRLMDPASKLK